MKQSCIPEVVSSENFEKTVVNIFNAINVKISNIYIEACHRFGIKKIKMLMLDLQIGNIVYLLCAIRKKQSPLTIQRRICPIQDFFIVKL